MELKTANEIAEVLRVTKQTVTNWVKEGCPIVTKLPLRFKLEEVIDWANRRGK